MVGGGDADDVDIRIRHDVTEVGEALGRLVAQVFHLLVALGEQALVDIAERRHFDVLLFGVLADMRPAPPL